MKKITEHISKEVVTVAEGKIAGVVTNAYVTEKLTRVKGWRVSSDEKEEAGFAALGRILGYGDALILPSAKQIEIGEFFPCPIGAKIFDSMGRFLGILRDLAFDEKTGVASALIADGKEFSPSLVLGASEKAVVFRAEEHAFKRFKSKASGKKRAPSARTRGKSESNEHFEPISEIERDEEIVFAENIDLSEKEQAATEDEIKILPEISEDSEGTHFLGDYEFLLGRTILKDLVAGNAILAERGATVTEKIVRAARENGKLVELTVNSKRV